jgi:hypothetical protein
MGTRGPNQATAGADGGGMVAFSNPGNGVTDDASYATVSLAQDESAILEVTNFGSWASANGVDSIATFVAAVKCKVNAGSDEIIWNGLDLIIDGVPTGNVYNPFLAVSTSEAYLEAFERDITDFVASLSVSKASESDFGLQLSFYNQGSNTRTLSVNASRLAIGGTFTGATQLDVAVHPSNVNTGVVISPSIVINALDELNNLDDDFTGNVTLSIATGTGSLGGTVTRAAVSGSATFDDITCDTAGTKTLAADSTGLTQAVSDSFVVSAGGATVKTLAALGVG